MGKETSPTPYAPLNQVLTRMVADFRAILPDNFVGAYLQGSFAVGDFDENSDVDFIVVVETDFNDAVMEQLQAAHRRIYALPISWAQHLEGSFFPRAVLYDSAHAGSDVWYVDHGAIDFERSDHCNTVVVRWSLRECGVTLAGPTPATLVAPISGDMVRRDVWATMQDWGAEILADSGRYNNHFYQAFITLNYCRMLQSLHTGTITSKRAGANWAKANLDPAWSGLIDRSWAGRPDPASSVRRRPDPADYAATLRFVKETVALGRQLMAG